MRSGNPTPSQRIKSGIAVLVSLAILIGGGTLVGLKVYEKYQDWSQRDDYVGAGEANITITIPEGATWTRAADILERSDVIADAETFLEVYAKKQKADQSVDLSAALQAGRYKMKTHWPAETALDYLLDPANREKITVQIPEGWRWADQIEPKLIEESDFSAADFDAAYASAADADNPLGLPAYANGQVEGYLFPDTYELPESAKATLALMVSTFNAKATALDLEAQAAAISAEEGIPITAHDVVVVASIIEQEVNIAADRPKVARVIYNRLAQGIPLGVESAFRYGRLMTDGTPYTDPITAESQQDVSLPYNYYQNPGLPGSAISNPGEAALQAAVNPAEGDWLYWVTVDLKNGTTKFTSDPAEFEEFVAEFNQWCADNGNPEGCQ
ncbi:MAG: endolytic transglycosylase MltG [Propionibacteriaceae bacterium]|jgi:UPF0755 protein|nr:endolytic transglycosylase MltG [Propionibacteriaceae bacterium]